MAINEMETKVREYREMKRLAEEAQAAADSMADELKAAMSAAGQDSRGVQDQLHGCQEGNP